MPTRQLSAAVCMVCLVILQILQGTSQGDDVGEGAMGLPPDDAILRQMAVSADQDGLAKLLGGLSSSDKQRKHIAALIAQLGSDEHREREAATEALKSLPRPPLRELQAA